MRHISAVLLSIILAGCVTSDKGAWKEKEFERRAKVHFLVEQLTGESLEDRKVAYAELRDTFLRKRDIPELTQEITRISDPEVRESLQDLVLTIRSECEWLLPGIGRTNDSFECNIIYRKEFEKVGYDATVNYDIGCSRDRVIIFLNIIDLLPIEEMINRNRKRDMAGAIELIHTLEPQSLKLLTDWNDISFIGILTNLEELTLGLYGQTVSDLTPLHGLPKLNRLVLCRTKVADLNQLKGLSGLEQLEFESTKITDLKFLDGLSKIRELSLVDEESLADLTPLKGLSELRKLSIQNVPVTDLTPLKGLPELCALRLSHTKVSDLTPLKELPKLERLYLDDAEGMDLSPLKGTSISIIIGKFTENWY